MFVDLDWRLNASSLLSASAELLVAMTYNDIVVTWCNSSLWLAAMLWHVQMWICCGLSICCGFVVDFQFVVDLLYSLLYSRSRTNCISEVWAYTLPPTVCIKERWQNWSTFVGCRLYFPSPGTDSWMYSRLFSSVGSWVMVVVRIRVSVSVNRVRVWMADGK